MDNLPDETNGQDHPSRPELASDDDLTPERQGASQTEDRFAVIDRLREAFKDVPAEEIEREAERSVAAARERRKRDAGADAR